MMMRGGKDEGRVMSPMFPRLHVNDTEKGGPRAPPRNKMALYEQLSIPSQRFNSGSPSMLPLPPSNNNSLVPLISSSHGGDNERSMFVPFGNTHESSILADKFHSYSNPGTNLNTTKGNQERKTTKAIDDNSLDTTPPIQAVSKSNPLQPLHFSNFKKFSLRKLGYDDDLRVPTSVLSLIEQNFSCSKQSEGRGIFSKLNLSSSMQLQTANEKQKENDSVDPKSRRYAGNQDEEKERLFRSRQNIMERSNSILSTRDEILADTSSDLSIKIKDSESLKRPHASYNQENKSSSVDILNSEDGPNARLHHEYVVTQDKMIFRENMSVESGRCLENTSKVRNESCMRQSLGVDDGSPNALENRIKVHEEKKGGAKQVGGVNRHNNVPDPSMLESESLLDICPDDVVGIIGEKHFWKVRSAIANQQRVFAVQVFELHRLIKVQRLIAGSPHILLEDTLYMDKPSLDVSPVKKLPMNYVSEPPLIIKVKDNSQKTNISIECADENAVAKLPLPSTNDDTSKGLGTGPYSGNASTTPMPANTRPSPWCFSPPGNQWLVPVMSPSEGLVYKPCTGPFPSTAGFLAPVYGSCGPVNLGDFLNTAYGVPASHHQGFGIPAGNPPIGQTYFPHYGMPVRNPSVSGSAVEQMGPFTGVQSKGNQFSTGDVNFTIAHQSSCNISSQMSQAISYCAGKLPASKESQIQGSSPASSPSERAKGDALPSLPTEPTTQASNHDGQTSGQRTRVIKVVPHNPRLATESAARIFQSIQEERKQYD
ncbi:LOW QUALITY PROTEIN: protein EARLY FLOWERING 3-like [Durio zibethinus]|uniref:LOW QUALITY PROTEIN: protein EARLY FLOWERING 3-like n=1 Tax=Durio zibethinus TaxID=66656 RepID=A0A6P5WGH9_DURZI|nr:LOW QUALITY PROTEIN: protein EARLY FLOWERING 3-like [Durio zibethinus]